MWTSTRYSGSQAGQEDRQLRRSRPTTSTTATAREPWHHHDVLPVGARQGRIGAGQLVVTSFSIPTSSLGYGRSAWWRRASASRDPATVSAIQSSLSRTRPSAHRARGRGRRAPRMVRWSSPSQSTPSGVPPRRSRRRGDRAYRRVDDRYSGFGESMKRKVGFGSQRARAVLAVWLTL